MKAKPDLKNLLLAGLFAGLTAICSWISLPLFFTPVPINMALLGPYLAGILIGSKYGALSQIIYILMGILGIPVFSGFASGIGIIMGPTGGFIAGYVACAALCGLVSGKKDSGCRILLMICGLFSCYFIGLIWFISVTGSSLRTGLVSCVLPFIPGDAVKITAAAILSKYLSNAVKA